VPILCGTTIKLYLAAVKVICGIQIAVCLLLIAEFIVVWNGFCQAYAHNCRCY
jgi:hypothetical protein